MRIPKANAATGTAYCTAAPPAPLRQADPQQKDVSPSGRWQTLPPVQVGIGIHPSPDSANRIPKRTVSDIWLCKARCLKPSRKWGRRFFMSEPSM